jgi:hypothetical protein
MNLSFLPPKIAALQKLPGCRKSVENKAKTLENYPKGRQEG